MGNEEKTEHLASLDFEKVSKSDVGIDLKMKTTDTSSPLNSYPYKRTMFMPPPPQYPPLFSSGKDTSSSTFLGDDGVSRSIHVGSSDVYDAVSSGPAAALLSKPFNTCARASMALSEKAPFTASQLQELQRQTIICKYIMASMPVPPQLLLPLPNYPSPAQHPQSNRSGLDLKFSSGSDPEPWRCKRTDGKKWRCSRDVAPDQKYCERHAHKSKPRSRKPVEIHTTNNSNRHPSIVPPVASRNHQSLQFPTVQLSADQTRCIEWLGRGDRSGTTIPVINCNQQNLQQLMQSSPRMGFNNDHTDQNRRNTPAFQMQDESKVYPMNFNQYISNRSNGQIVESPLKNEEYSDSVIASLQGRTTRDFIDAWSKDGLNDGLSNNGSSTSLTLSMSGWNHGLDDDNEHAQVSIGTLDSERSSDEVLRSQWLNPVSWMTSTAPGGPLGEALCLGNASNLPSPHGYSNSTATSSCSFNSCENGSHGIDFIG